MHSGELAEQVVERVADALVGGAVSGPGSGGLPPGRAWLGPSSGASAFPFLGLLFLTWKLGGQAGSVLFSNLLASDLHPCPQKKPGAEKRGEGSSWG